MLPISHRFFMQKRISVMAFVFADGHRVLPAAVFQGNRKASPSNSMTSYPVSELLRSPRERSWKKGKRSSDSFFEVGSKFNLTRTCVD